MKKFDKSNLSIGQCLLTVYDQALVHNDSSNMGIIKIASNSSNISSFFDDGRWQTSVLLTEIPLVVNRINFSICI